MNVMIRFAAILFILTKDCVAAFETELGTEAIFPDGGSCIAPDGSKSAFDQDGLGIQVIDNFLSHHDIGAILDVESNAKHCESIHVPSTVAAQFKHVLADGGQDILQPWATAVADGFTEAIPCRYEESSVSIHQDHNQDLEVSTYVGLMYLNDAPGTLVFSEYETKKEVERIQVKAGRFISWENNRYLHSFEAPKQGFSQRSFLGPMTLNSVHNKLESVGVGVAPAPTAANLNTTAAPTIAPTAAPTIAPTAAPTIAPTAAPIMAPTAAPIMAPTAAPIMAPTAAPIMAPTLAPADAPTTSSDSIIITVELDVVYINDNGFTAQEFIDVYCTTGLDTAFERAFNNQFPEDNTIVNLESTLELTVNANGVVVNIIEVSDCDGLDFRRRRLDESVDTSLNSTTYNYTVIFDAEVEEDDFTSDGATTVAEALASFEDDFNESLIITDTKIELDAIGNDTEGDGLSVLEVSVIEEVVLTSTALDPTLVPTPAQGVSCTTDFDCDYGQFCDFTGRRQLRSLLFGSYYNSYTTQGVCADE